MTAAAARAPRAGTTTAAAVLIFLSTALWALAGVALVIVGLVVDQNELVDEFDVTGGLRDTISGLFIGIGLVVLGIAAWCIVLGVKIFQRRSWARTGGIVTYSIFAALFLLGALSALGGGGSGSGSGSVDGGSTGESNPGGALVPLVINGAIVALLVSRPTRDDVARVAALEQGAYSGYGSYGGGYGGGYGWGPPGPPGPPGPGGWAQPGQQGTWERPPGGGWQPPGGQQPPPGGGGWAPPAPGRGWGQPPSSTPPTGQGWTPPAQPPPGERPS